MLPDHGVVLHAEGEGVAGGFEANHIDGHGKKFVCVPVAAHAETFGHDAEDRDAQAGKRRVNFLNELEGSRLLVIRGEPTAGDESLDVTRCASCAGPTEMGRYFADRWGRTTGLQFLADEIIDSLLDGGEWGHGAGMRIVSFPHVNGR